MLFYWYKCGPILPRRFPPLHYLYCFTATNVELSHLAGFPPLYYSCCFIAIGTNVELSHLAGFHSLYYLSCFTGANVELSYLASFPHRIIISPVSEGSGDVMVLRRSRPPPATHRPPPAARNGVNAITKKPRDGLFSNLVYTLVVIVSWPD